MVDVERDDGKPRKELQDSLQVLLNLLTDAYGKEPMIYGTNRSYNELCAPEFNNYLLYIGRYGENKPVVKGPSHSSSLSATTPPGKISLSWKGRHITQFGSIQREPKFQVSPSLWICVVCTRSMNRAALSYNYITLFPPFFRAVSDKRMPASKGRTIIFYPR